MFGYLIRRKYVELEIFENYDDFNGRVEFNFFENPNLPLKLDKIFYVRFKNFENTTVEFSNERSPCYFPVGILNNRKRGVLIVQHIHLMNVFCLYQINLHKI